MNPLQGRRLIHRLRRYLGHKQDISTDYALLEQPEGQRPDGWRVKSVAERQHQAFLPLLEAARAGQPREDFVAVAKAIAITGLVDPLVAEIGCGSGYYSEILPLLLGHPVRYVGIDYATSMTALAYSNYPNISFATGDACCLPLQTGSCDIMLSGTSLMHIAEYQRAIAEGLRVSRHWCIFHTVPVMANRPTTFLRKRAYGEPVIEVIFNRSELESVLTAGGLEVHEVFESIPYDVSPIVGEPTRTLTYLCHKLVLNSNCSRASAS